MREQEGAVGGQQPQIRLQTHHHHHHPSNVSQCHGVIGVPVWHLSEVAVQLAALCTSSEVIKLQRLIHSSYIIFNVYLFFNLGDLSTNDVLNH